MTRRLLHRGCSFELHPSPRRPYETLLRARHRYHVRARLCGSQPTPATKGYRQVIVTGRRLAQVQKTAAQLAAETKKTQVFTPLELDLNSPSSVQSAVDELVKRGQPIDFLLLNAGLVPFKQRVLTAAGVEFFSGPAHRASSTDCRVAQRQLAEPQRADRYRRRRTCSRGRAHVQIHRPASLRGQTPQG